MNNTVNATKKVLLYCYKKADPLVEVAKTALGFKGRLLISGFQAVGKIIGGSKTETKPNVNPILGKKYKSILESKQEKNKILEREYSKVIEYKPKESILNSNKIGLLILLLCFNGQMMVNINIYLFIGILSFIIIIR